MVLNYFSTNIMGCCLSKKTKKPSTKKKTIIEPIPEISNDNTKPPMEQAKLWLQESPKKEEKIEQPIMIIESPPQVPSKRRQLLKELFKEAREKQAKNQTKQHKLNIQKMETMDSACEAGQQKSRSLATLEQAIREMIKNNKEELTCCGICTEQYDQNRLPMMVCMNQHTYCSQCLRDLWNKGYKRCPLDQSPYDIDSIQKNRIVLSILNQMPQK